jgi:hypothetical protein
LPDDKDDIMDKFKDIEHSKEVNDLKKGIKKKTYREKVLKNMKKANNLEI